MKGSTMEFFIAFIIGLIVMSIEGGTDGRWKK
jgi:hypothetical protein